MRAVIGALSLFVLAPTTASSFAKLCKASRSFVELRDFAERNRVRDKMHWIVQRITDLIFLKYEPTRTNKSKKRILLITISQHEYTVNLPCGVFYHSIDLFNRFDYNVRTSRRRPTFCIWVRSISLLRLQFDQKLKCKYYKINFKHSFLSLKIKQVFRKFCFILYQNCCNKPSKIFRLFENILIFSNSSRIKFSKTKSELVTWRMFKLG